MFGDICVTTNASIKVLYESPAKEVKGWGDAGVLTWFSLLNMRAYSRCTQTFRGHFFLRVGTCYTENGV